jgi:hypothetical protein
MKLSGNSNNFTTKIRKGLFHDTELDILKESL